MTNRMLGVTNEGAMEIIDSLARERMFAYAGTVGNPPAHWPTPPVALDPYLETSRRMQEYQHWLMHHHSAPSFSPPVDVQPSVQSLRELKQTLATYADAYSAIVGSLVDEFVQSLGEDSEGCVAGESAGELLNEFDDDEVSEFDCVELEYNEECLPLVELKIRQIMRAKGVNQTQLAEMVGITSASISKVLKSPEKSKIVTLAKIAKALNVSLSMFFRESPGSHSDA